MFQIKLSQLVRIFILVFLVFLCYELYFDYSSLIILCDDEDEVRKAVVHNVQEGSMEFRNVKVTGLKAVADSLGEPMAFSAGLAGIVKLLKSSNLPLTSKIALTLGVGASSFAIFSVTRTSLRMVDPLENRGITGKITAEISEVSVQASNEISSSSSSIRCVLESSEELLYGHVSTLLLLQITIVYLLVQLLIFYTMKQISSANFKFESVKSWIYGEKIQWLLLKSMSMWEKSSNLWIYFVIVFLIISSSASVFGVYAILVSIS